MAALFGQERRDGREAGLEGFAVDASSIAADVSDRNNAIIVDVEATTAIRQAEVLAAKRMVERSFDGFDRYPKG